MAKKVLFERDGISYHVGDRILYRGRHDSKYWPGTLAGLGLTDDTVSVWMDDVCKNIIVCTDSLPCNRIYPYERCRDASRGWLSKLLDRRRRDGNKEGS